MTKKLPLSRQTLDYTAEIIRRHRKRIGSCWRKLNPGRQALLVLAYLRNGRRSPSWPQTEVFAEDFGDRSAERATAERLRPRLIAVLDGLPSLDRELLLVGSTATIYGSGKYPSGAFTTWVLKQDRQLACAS